MSSCCWWFIVGGVVDVVCGGGFGVGATATRVGRFVDKWGMIVFGGVVGFAVGEEVVGVRASPILPIAINTTDKIGDMLIGGVEFGVVVVNVGDVVVCCGCGCCCC